MTIGLMAAPRSGADYRIPVEATIGPHLQWNVGILEAGPANHFGLDPQHIVGVSCDYPKI